MVRIHWRSACHVIGVTIVGNIMANACLWLGDSGTESFEAEMLVVPLEFDQLAQGGVQ